MAVNFENLSPGEKKVEKLDKIEVSVSNTKFVLGHFIELEKYICCLLDFRVAIKFSRRCNRLISRKLKSNPGDILELQVFEI